MCTFFSAPQASLQADHVRGRPMKTAIDILRDGSVVIETNDRKDQPNPMGRIFPGHSTNAGSQREGLWKGGAFWGSSEFARLESSIKFQNGLDGLISLNAA
jgi:hypothetical protein